ncbi:hypothetical protein Tco_1567209 [Tanacetum coccineum]
MAFMSTVVASHFPSTNLEHLPIQETKLPFRMAELLFNEFKGDKVRILLVQELREMLQALGEIMLQVKQGLLSVTIVKGKGIWQGSALSLRGQGILHGSKKRCCWFRHRNLKTKTVNESLTAELERYKERVKKFKQRLNINLSSREKMIDSQMDDMIWNRNALKQEIDSLKQTLSKQVKEKESLLQTFTVFKKESKEKENKYMDKQIDLENKIKELDNIVYTVGQSTLMVHMLTKPQVFYDDTHKQALGYQNPFYLKKA